MQCELVNIFRELESKIPTSTDELFTFSAEVLPVPPLQITSERIFIKKSEHHYGSYRTDLLWICAHKKTYRYLGLLTLAVLFHPEPSKVKLNLVHPESDIKNLIIEYEYEELGRMPNAYITRPFGYNYYADEMAKHPWVEYKVEPDNLPAFSLTNLTDCLITSEDWKNRDTVYGFGRDFGLIHFAELLLNAGRPQNTGTEYELEGEMGYRGVAPGSAEVTLHLPGHFSWNEDAWSSEF
jgi:hypothetical protein